MNKAFVIFEDNFWGIGNKGIQDPSNKDFCNNLMAQGAGVYSLSYPANLNPPTYTGWTNRWLKYNPMAKNCLEQVTDKCPSFCEGSFWTWGSEICDNAPLENLIYVHRGLAPQTKQYEAALNMAKLRGINVITHDYLRSETFEIIQETVKKIQARPT